MKASDSPAGRPACRSRYSRISRRRRISTASRSAYSSSEMSPVSTAICSSSSSSLTALSSISSCSAMVTTCLRHQRMPATGPVIGRRSRRSMISIQARRRHHGAFARALQLEPNVDEVVWRPRARIAEGQPAFVFLGDLLHAAVELFGLLALHQEGRVEDHLVADGLAGSRGDSRIAQVVVDLGHEVVRPRRQRLLDQAAKLHPREIRRGRGAVDLLLEAADLLVLFLDLANDGLTVPVDFEAQLDLVAHLLEHVHQRI